MSRYLVQQMPVNMPIGMPMGELVSKSKKINLYNIDPKYIDKAFDKVYCEKIQDIDMLKLCFNIKDITFK